VIPGVERDPSLPHQPVLYNPSGDGGHPALTCNCRQRRRMPDLGRVVELSDTVRVYNDPNNHVEPFYEADRLTVKKGHGPHGLSSQGV
jgi:hypothetical protein